MSAYISDDDVKATLILDGTTFADADVTRAVDAANGAVDELLGRSFQQDADASDRYYSVRRRGAQVLYIHDLTRASEPVVSVDSARDGSFADVLVENTDFFFEPLNAVEDGKPYEKIALERGFLPKGRRMVKVAGTFGWPEPVPPQIVAFAEVLAIKLVTRLREAPFGIVTAGADMAVAMRLARSDPDFPTLAAGLCKGALIH